MNFGLIIVGDEILSGKRQDKHLPKVIDLLAARGLSLSWARYVSQPQISGGSSSTSGGMSQNGIETTMASSATSVAPKPPTTL